MSNKKGKCGGDKKSGHFFTRVMGKKNGSFMADFFASAKGKSEILMDKNVIASKAAINSCAIKLHKLNTLLAASLNKKSCAAVSRCEFDDDCPNWFNASKGKFQLEWCLLWMNANERISSCKSHIKAVSGELVYLEADHTRIFQLYLWKLRM